MGDQNIFIKIFMAILRSKFFTKIFPVQDEIFLSLYLFITFIRNNCLQWIWDLENKIRILILFLYFYDEVLN